MGWYLRVIKNYAVFTGRARRMEYWMFVFFNLIFVNIIAAALDSAFFGTNFLSLGPLAIIYSLFVIIPGLAVVIRRLHDIGKSGWYILILLIPIIGQIWFFVLLVTEGERGQNRYGVDPKYV